MALIIIRQLERCGLTLNRYHYYVRWMSWLRREAYMKEMRDRHVFFVFLSEET
jgi:hypothetical protein